MTQRGGEPEVWSVSHLVQGESGIAGYQIVGPASFLIFGDEVDGLMALLAGIKVDEAVAEVAGDRMPDPWNPGGVA